ncbi:MAG: hypothetical protein DSZ03_03390 [Sulfurimonas sp.]|nr:MAG: hypothetical protein DSZ03_03390 [Sulfurimonas sp.]
MPFIIIWAIIISTVHAGSFMMHDRVCANPVKMDNIVVVCNDINFSSANDEYAVYMYEVNQDLQIRRTTTLDIADVFVEKAMKINATEILLIAETQSKCVEVLTLNVHNMQLHTVVTHCATSALSLEDEYHPHTLLFDDGSLLFSMEREGVQSATVELLYLQDLKHQRYATVSFPEYKDYVIFKMMPYKEGAVVMLRSQKHATDTVLLRLHKNKQGSFDTSVLYETHTQTVASFDIDDATIFLYGNEVSQKQMSLFLYAIDAKGVLHRYLDAFPMAFQPVGLTISKTLFLTGVLTNTRKKPFELGLLDIAIDHGKARVSYERLDRHSISGCSAPILVEGDDYMSLFFNHARQVVRIDPVKAQVKEKILLPVSHVLLIPNSPRFLKFSHKMFLTYTAIEGNTIKNIIQEVGKQQ